MELFWHQAPLVRLLVPFALGIISAISIPFALPPYEWMLGTGIGLIVIILIFSGHWKDRRANPFFGLLTSASLFAFGMASALAKVERISKDIPQAALYRGIIENAPVEKRNSYSVSIKLVSGLAQDEAIDLSRFRIVAFFPKSGFPEGLKPGTVIQFNRRPEMPEGPRHPKQFDYSKYLMRQGYSATVYLPKESYGIESERKYSLTVALNALRTKLLDKMRTEAGDGPEFGVISALVLGHRDDLDPDLRRDFANAGAVHILAVSGLHVGIIYLFLLTLFDRLAKGRRNWAGGILIIALLWLYAGLTGFSPSVLRASTMFSFITLAKFSGRFGNTYNMIAGSALLLLVVNPLLIVQPGFQLSYLAVIGIVFYFPRFRSLWLPESRLMDKVWSLVCVSLAAQLATFPLSIYYFNQFPALFLLTNLLVIPMATIILYAGLLWVAMLWLPSIAAITAGITLEAAGILNHVVEFVSALSFSTLNGIYLLEAEVILIYGGIIFITLFLIKPTKFRLRMVYALSLGLLVSFKTGSLTNTMRREVYFPNESNNPSLVLIEGKSAKVFASDTAAIREFLNRDMKVWLFSRGIDPADCSINALAESLAGNGELWMTERLEEVQFVHLGWHPGSGERIIKYDSDYGIMEEDIKSLPVLHAYRLQDFTPFSTDRLLQTK